MSLAPSNNWHTARLGGLQTPGTIPKGGITGFARKTGWDILKGKGTAGATLVRKTRPPAKGSITLLLVDGIRNNGRSVSASTDLDDWALFVDVVLSVPAAQQQTQGLAFFYAGMANNSDAVTKVVVEEYSLVPIHVGKGLYHVKIDLIEWYPPPAASIVSSIKSVAPDVPDPILSTKSAEAQELQAAIAAKQAKQAPTQAAAPALLGQNIIPNSGAE